jgi:L-alanine-DL-glutamate epimerase-like enolase superfamily enzyme
MKIEKIEIRACRHPASMMSDSEMRDGRRSDLEFLVLSAWTDNGLRADTFGFAGRGAAMAAEIAADVIKPFFLGKDPLYREKHWHDFRMVDRWWNHVPIYSYGPFDILCWLFGALDAKQPLYRYLGAYRDQVPIYSSSLTLAKAEDYARQAVAVRDRGWAAYKLHPLGKEKEDIEAYRLCREAVGPDFTLMADPVAAYNHQQALRIGRELEKLNYYWLEEPLFDTDLHGLRELARELDIPICGTEVLAGSHYSTAECITSRAVDIVRTDVSWKGGITPTLKTAHLAESFGVQCELHTTIYHPLELVNLHCCAAIKNCEFFEVLEPWNYFNFGLKEQIRVEKGHAILPTKPGLGIDLDWDFIDRCTFDVK